MQAVESAMEQIYCFSGVRKQVPGRAATAFGIGRLQSLKYFTTGSVVRVAT